MFKRSAQWDLQEYASFKFKKNKRVPHSKEVPPHLQIDLRRNGIFIDHVYFFQNVKIFPNLFDSQPFSVYYFKQIYTLLSTHQEIHCTQRIRCNCCSDCRVVSYNVVAVPWRQNNCPWMNHWVRVSSFFFFAAASQFIFIFSWYLQVQNLVTKYFTKIPYIHVW